MEIKHCISCKKSITNDKGAVEFKCPNCGDSVIIRCAHCRNLAAEFTCPKCGFTGPN